MDYSCDNFLDTAFTAEEQRAIASTLLINEANPNYGIDGGNDTIDNVFLLSIEEAKNTLYGFTSDTGNTNTRVSTNTAYVAGGGKIESINMRPVVGAEQYWWRVLPA